MNPELFALRHLCLLLNHPEVLSAILIKQFHDFHFLLLQAMEEDIENGMIPFFVSTTLGTTGCVAFDNLEEIGKKLFSLTSSTDFVPCCVHYVRFTVVISQLMLPNCLYRNGHLPI